MNKYFEMGSHTSPRIYSGSALITVIVMSAILLIFLGVIFSFTSLTQTQAARETRRAQSISLGNAGLNHALAQYRSVPNYAGESYEMATGMVDTYITGDATKVVITAQSYVPDKNTASRVCKAFRIDVDPSVTPPQVIPKTYQELGACETNLMIPASNQPPTLSIHEPDGTDDVTAGGLNYPVTYSANDPDNVVTTVFYYDTDNTGYNGTPIGGPCAVAIEGANQACNWTITNVPAGDYYVYGVVSDGYNGTVRAYSPGKVTIQNSPPTLTLITPEAGTTNVAKGANYAIQYSLADADNEVTAGLYFDTDNAGFDGTAIASCSAVTEINNGSCAWNTASMPTGTYSVYAVTTDGVNPPVQVYAPGQVQIVNAPPTLNITQPDGSDDTLYVGGSFVVHYSYTDSDATGTVALGFDADATGYNGTAISGCSQSGQGTDATCTWNTTGVAPGSYYIYGTTTGANGSAQAYSLGKVTILALEPELSVNEPNGVNDTIGAGTIYTIKYTYSDPIATGKVAFYYDTDAAGFNGTALTGPCASSSVGTNATCNWTTTSIPAGTYFIYGVTSNTSGQSVKAYAPGALTINAAPAITVLTPTVGTSVTIGQTVTIQYTLADPDDVTNATFYINPNSTGTGTAISNGTCATARPEGTNVSCTWNTTGTQAGSYYIYAVAKDSVNAPVTDYSPAKYTLVGTPPNASPTLSISDPDGVNDSVTRANPNYTIRYTLNDPDNTVVVRFYADTDASGFNGTALSGACGSGVGEGTNLTCTWDTSNLGYGTHYLYGVTTDGVNGVVQIYAPGFITITNEAPVLSISNPDGTNDTVTPSNPQFPLTYSLSDPDETVTVKFYYDSDASGFNGTLLPGSCGTGVGEGINAICSIPTSTLPYGSYYVYGVTNDGVNPEVKAYSPGAFTYSNAAPTLSFTAPTQNSNAYYYTDFTFKINLNDPDDAVTAKLYIDSNSSGFDGTEIYCHNIGSSALSEGTDVSCTWRPDPVLNSSGQYVLPAGNYYVYGITQDSTNPAVKVYASPVITLINQPTYLRITNPQTVRPGVSLSYETATVGDRFPVGYILTDPDDVAKVDLFYDTDNQGYDGTAISNCQNFGERAIDNAACLWNTTGMPVGDYYVYGISKGDLINPPAKAYSTGPVFIREQCDDLLDNDGDVARDYPDDAGCANANDADETGNFTSPTGAKNSEDRVFDLDRDTAGNTYVVGYRKKTLDTDLVIRKYRSNGTVEVNFGTSGSVIYNNPDGPAEGYAIAVAGSKIYVVGTQKSTGQGSGWIIRKYNTDGSIDTGFGTAGMVTYVSGFSSQAYKISVDSLSGDIYVGGNLASSYYTSSIMGVRKYNAQGKLYDGTAASPAWGESATPGMGSASSTQGGNFFTDMVRDASGNIYATGYRAGSGMVTVKFASNGTRDLTFGTSGEVTYSEPGHLLSGKDKGLSIALDAAQNIYIAGQTLDTNGTVRGFIRKYNASGQLYNGTTASPSWGDTATPGMVLNPTDIGTEYRSVFQKIRFDSTGNLYAATSTTDGHKNETLRYIKYNASGSRDTGFSSGVGSGTGINFKLTATNEIYSAHTSYRGSYPSNPSLPGSYNWLINMPWGLPNNAVQEYDSFLTE